MGDRFLSFDGIDFDVNGERLGNFSVHTIPEPSGTLLVIVAAASLTLLRTRVHRPANRQTSQ